MNMGRASKFYTSTYTSVGLRDTLSHDFLVTLLVACISAVLALVANGVEQEFVAERT